MKSTFKLFLVLMVGTGLLGGYAYAQQGTTPYSPASMFIWTDKVVYQPGDAITLRWTARANGDTAPYTCVIYRQNNTTGVKSYFKLSGAPSTTPSDIFGKSEEDGFTQVILGDVTKSVVIGNGGWLQASYAAPNELGMHTFAVELRNATGTRIVKTAYVKFNVVSGFQTISGDISTDRTLDNTIGYKLSGIVTIKNDATLTIPPGTLIQGLPGTSPPSVLLVGVNGKIMAKGTRSRPIIFTSNQPVGQRRPSDWGGVVSIGKAPINVEGGVADVEGIAPGSDTTYGGTDPNHNCGTLEYVRVEFGGIALAPNSEINNFTWAGCGKDTVADHLQSRYGYDDAFEWFGGTMDAKYLAGEIGRDDFLDSQLGFVGRVQHGVMVSYTDQPGNRGIELDDSEFDDKAVPLNKPQIYNVTFVGAGNALTSGVDEPDSAGIYIRRGGAGTFNNLLILNWVVNGISIRNNSGSTATTDSITRGDLTMDGIMLWDNGKASGRANTLDGQAADFGVSGQSGFISNQVARDFLHGTIGSARNILVADPMLRRPLIGPSVIPDFLPTLNSPVFRANWVQPPDDGFFDQWARWNGGFGFEDWTEEWTYWALEDDLTP
jgi:hypothetical protein